MLPSPWMGEGRVRAKTLFGEGSKSEETVPNRSPFDTLRTIG